MCHLLKSLCCCGGRIPPLLSSAPNESVLICAICGRLSSAAGSVNSVQSVGGLLFAECILPQISQIYTEVRLSSRGCTCAICGSHFAAAEARIPPLLSSAPNESVLICAICGRTAVCSVGALETSAPPENASVPSVGGSPQQQVL